MGAIGLNPIRLDRIGLDPIRINAIKLGVPGASSGSDRPYIDPEVLASLKAVCICYGKSNDDPDRAVVKNLVDPDNPFVISNAAYKGMSGYNGYPNSFNDYTVVSGVTKTESSIKIEKELTGSGWFLYIPANTPVASMKLKIDGIPSNRVIKWNTNVEGIGDITLTNGVNEIPAYTSSAVSGIYTVYSNLKDFTITQIPSFEGAFVTDGVDDLITSTKTVQEMGITEACTVISMIHQIDLNSTYTIATTNYIENSNSREHVRSDVYNYGKTGIYGYSASLINNTKSDIKNILGDEADYYVKSTNSLQTIFDAKFSVVGRISELTEASQVAWYWTIIANKVLTTDQINQVIAYFNLDRTLKPDILCNTIKQGITNENHAEFGDKLIDFSGNGRDIQLNNLAWKGGSGIAAKQYETFKDWTNTSYQTSTVTEIDEFTRVVDSTSNAYWVSMINRTSDFDKVHDSINIVLYQDDMLLVHECKYKIDENVTTKALYETLKSGVNTITLATIDKFTDIPEDAEIMSLGEWVNPKSNKGSVKITLLPSYKGGLLLDGVNDFGKVTGMPIYKDYTFIIDYERISYTSEGWGGAIVSKSPSANNGAFISMMANSAGTNKQLFSFGGVTAFIKDDLSRILFWQTKYKSENTELTVGEGVDGDTLWLGTLRDNDSRFFNGAIYSLMSFPYSMSEFLIERQLKKHKLGTLYPNMVEFRPVIKSSVELVNKPSFAIRGTSTLLNAGDYIPENSEIWVVITMNNVADRITKFVINGNTIDIPSSAYNPSTMKYGFPFTIDSKSPQKITMTIEQDENYVKWNPVVESNVEYQVVDSYIDNYPAVVGNYYPINSQLRIAVTTKGAADEVTSLTINGTSLGTPSVNGNRFTFNGTLSDKSPQKINITIYQPPEYLTMLSNSTLISNETLIKNE